MSLKITAKQYIAWVQRSLNRLLGSALVSDGTDTAKINLSGQYAAEDFHIASDGASGTLVTYVHVGLPPTDLQV